LGSDTLTGGAGADTFSYGTDGSIAGDAEDTILDYTSATDIIKFGSATATIVAAGVDNSDLAAATNVQVDTGGVVIFHAGDNLLSEKIIALQADAGLGAEDQVALFKDGSDSYVYYSGATSDNADDQIIKLKDVNATGFVISDNKITSVAYVPDTTPPTATVSTMSLSVDAGVINTDFITNEDAQNITLTYTGTLATGELLKVSLDDGLTWTDATLVSGSTWRLTGQTIEDEMTIQAAVFDAAGNYSTAVSHDVVLDVAAPDSPTIALNTDTGAGSSDGITSNNAVDVSDIETDTTWEYTLDATVGTPTWVTGTGSSFNMTANTTYIINKLGVRQTDVAGNVSEVGTNEAQWVEDSISPTASAFTATATTVGATSSQAATGGLKLVKASDGSALGTPVTEGDFASNGSAATVTVLAQSAATPATLKVFDTAGNVATSTQSVFLGKDTDDASGLSGTANADFIFGFGGSDVITGEDGVDTMIGGDGNDKYILDAGSSVTHTGNSATDVIYWATGDTLAMTTAGSASNYSEAGAAADSLDDLVTAANSVLGTAVGGVDVLYYVGAVGDDTYIVSGTQLIQLVGTTLDDISSATIVAS
jgi:hypothetical protein